MERYVVNSLVLFALAVVVGCEENIAPRDNFEIPYSMYGVLSPDLDTQSVRLYPLEEFPTLGSSEQIEVDVTSTNLVSGERHVWTDSVMLSPNGQHEYVFWAPFRAEFGHEYRVEAVRRSDQATSRAEVKIPSPVTVTINDLDPSAVEVYIEGEDIRALKPRAMYTVSPVGGGAAGRRSFSFSYEERERPIAQGWQVEVNLVADYTEMVWQWEAPLGRFCSALDLHKLVFHLLVGDAVWDPPGGVFDPNILSEPHTMSNVENGFGFIGGGYRIVERLRPSREAVEYACFVYVW